MQGMIPSPYDATQRLMLAALERNILPDTLTRRLCRMLLAERLRSGYKATAELQLSDLLSVVHALKEMPIAIGTNDTKIQRFVLTNSFFKLVLGENLKNSSGYFSDKSTTLDEAEKAMLERYCERSQLKDGHSVLDIGCGFGALTLFIAKKYSNCKITGITRAKIEKDYIDEQCRLLDLHNVEIFQADICSFEIDETFDRVFSISMFEGMKNYRDLLKKISKWMKEDGLLYVEHYCHKTFAYHYEGTSGHDWIAQTFFSGVTMPSANLLLYFQDDVSVVDHWLDNGKHYARSMDGFLQKMDKNAALIKPIMESTYGEDQAVKWTAFWRTLFIAYSELFGYNNGEEWMNAHFLFKKK